jgi:flagellar biosynthetic protein FliR
MISGLLDDLGVGLLVLARVLAMIQVAPLLSSRTIPQVGKIGLAVFIALIALPGVASAGYPLPPSGMQYGLLLLGEALLGALLGFLVYLTFAALRLAGQFISLSVGFGVAELFDPLSGHQSPLLSQVFTVLAFLVFLSVGGLHRLLLVGVAGSFQAVRAGDLVISMEAGALRGAGLLLQRAAGSLTRLFSTALTIALPIFGALLLVSIALALLAKVAPQMNLLMLGLPVSLGAGLVLLLLTLPLLLDVAGTVIDGGFVELRRLLAELGAAARALPQGGAVSQAGVP